MTAALLDGACWIALSYSCLKLNDALNTRSYSFPKYKVSEDEKKKKRDLEDKPPYDGQSLGNDPSKCPGEGFEWKGTDKPGTGYGSWVKGKGEDKEIFYPDLEHPAPIGPHWDYTGQGYKGRFYPDGQWKPKN